MAMYFSDPDRPGRSLRHRAALLVPDGDGSNTASIFITNVASEPGDPTHLTFENDYFGAALNATFSAHSNIGDCGTFTFAYNTFGGSMGGPEGSGCTTTGLTWAYNLASRPAFYECAGTHTGNPWQDDRAYDCGSPALEAAEESGYCTGALLGLDREGDRDRVARGATSRPTSAEAMRSDGFGRAFVIR